MPRAIPDDHRDRIIEAIQFTDRDYLLIRLLFSTGLRATEAAHLRVRDILDPSGVAMKIVRLPWYKGHRKNPERQDQEIVIPDGLLLDLARYVQGADLDHPLFPSKSGKPLYRQDIRLIFKRACKEAKVPAYRVHDTRHTYLTALLDTGADVRTVQAMARHSSLTTTVRYLHTTPARRIEAAEKVGV